MFPLCLTLALDRTSLFLEALDGGLGGRGGVLGGGGGGGSVVKCETLPMKITDETNIFISQNTTFASMRYSYLTCRCYT